MAQDESEFIKQWNEDEAKVASLVFQWMVENYEAYKRGNYNLYNFDGPGIDTYRNGMYCHGLTRLPDTEWYLLQIGDEFRRRVPHDNWDLEMIIEVWDTGVWDAVRKFQEHYPPDYNEY